MFTQKLASSWRIIFAMLMLSSIYVLAALTLLQTHKNSIEFTQKELQGVKDYERIAPLYFALGKAEKNHINTEKAREILHQIRHIGDTSNLTLDPEITSYYAMNLIFKDVPLLMEQTVIHNNKLPLFDSFQHSLSVLQNSQCDGCEALIILADQLKKDLLSSHKTKEQLLDVMLQISMDGSAILKTLLERRLTGATNQYGYVLLTVIAIYIALISLVIISFRNYVHRREIESAKEREHFIIELAKKNGELEKFAHAAAHDLKEPVRTMRCFATLLKSESKMNLSEATIEYVSIIENTAKRAEEMINDLLGYTRASEDVLVKTQCDCEQELANILDDLKSVLDPLYPQITISPLPTLHTVTSMFRRATLNLLDNAIKYRKNNEPLIISVACEKREYDWQFSIRDNGIGIAMEYSDMVFEPFKRLEPAKYIEGSGIGLTSCKKIIERLGGKIWIDSKPGSGTTVYFTLPL
jgi:signal transduction histidine kinase